MTRSSWLPSAMPSSSDGLAEDDRLDVGDLHSCPPPHPARLSTIDDDCLQSRAVAGHAPSTARSTSTRPGKHFGRLEVPRSTNTTGWSHLLRPDRDASTAATARRCSCSAASTATSPRARSRRCASRARPSPADVAGRLIVIPCASMEASHANTRLWPSGANFNRSFPGSPDGAARRAARRLHHALPDRRGRHRDRHAQRRPLEPVRRVVGDALGRRPGAAAADGRRRCSRGTRRCTSSTSTSPAPACSSARPSGRGRSSSRPSSAAAGTCSRRRTAIAIDGLRNVLRHFGVLAGEVATRESLGLEPPVIVRATDDDNYLFAPDAGHWETLVDVGRPRRGGPARRPHPLHRPPRPRADARRTRRATASCASCARSRRAEPGDNVLVIGRADRRRGARMTPLRRRRAGRHHAAARHAGRLLGGAQGARAGREGAARRAGARALGRRAHRRDRRHRPRLRRRRARDRGARARRAR